MPPKPIFNSSRDTIHRNTRDNSENAQNTCTKVKELGFKFDQGKFQAPVISHTIFDNNRTPMNQISDLLQSGTIVESAEDNSDISTQGMVRLGTPIGSDNFITNFIQQKLDEADVSSTPFEDLTAREKTHLTCYSANAQFNHLIRQNSGHDVGTIIHNN